MKNKILVLTPTFTGGSGIILEELVKKLTDQAEILMLGLGPGRQVPGTKTIKLSYFMFDKLNHKIGSNIIFNVVYQIPLLIGAVVYSLFWRPQFIISNGFTPLLIVMWFTKLLGTKTIVYYGSVLERRTRVPWLKFILKKLDWFIDYAFVNSTGAFQDLGKVLNPRKLIIIEHWTEMTPVTKLIVKQIRKKYLAEKTFVILYVGKFSPDKGCELLFKLIKSFAQSKIDVQYWFIGTGELLPKVRELAEEFSNVKYLGYMQDRAILKNYLSSADAVYTYADMTYLGMPATEALACGTPIIVPDKPAILEKMNSNAVIDPRLVPKRIGWLIDAHDFTKAQGAFIDIIKNGQTKLALRQQCLAYAKLKYSVKNIQPALNLLFNKATLYTSE